MDEELDVKAEAGQYGGDAVDEEWHVVVDDLHDALPANPRLLGSGRRKDPDPGPAGLTFGGEAPKRERRIRQIRRTARDHIHRWHVLVEGPDEVLDCAGIAADRSRMGGGQAGRLLDECGLLVFTAVQHRVLSWTGHFARLEGTSG